MPTAIRALGMVALVLTALAGAVTPLRADAARAAQLTAQAQALLAQEEYEPARGLLEQALQAQPGYLDAYLNLGYLAERQDQVEAALEAYAQALQISPGQGYAADRFSTLFRRGRFPQRLSPAVLALAPVPLTLDRVRAAPGLPGQALPVEAALAYTTGLLYPDQMRTGDGLPQIALPGGEQARFNRVAYGFLAEPTGGDLVMRVAVYYPSPTVSDQGQDYAALAVRLAHWLTRLEGYFHLYLGVPLPAEPTPVYLCEAGPAAAESYERELYFYRVDQPRAPQEWLREAAHEVGHLLLPRLGRFTAPEPWGSGHLGERLGLQWLAAEAGLVAGQPWPAEAAQQAVAPLWGGEDVDLAGYLAQRCRPLLDAWCQTGPESPLLAQDSEAALSYTLGFLLWVEAAHDSAVMAETLLGATGTNPTDYVQSYQAAVTRRLQRGWLPVYAGALSLPQSQLTPPPAEGALRREQVALAPGDSLELPLYLPAGAWAVTSLPSPLSASAQARLDETPVEVDSFGGLTLHTATPGWHRLRLQAPPTGKPWTLEFLRVEAAPPA